MALTKENLFLKDNDTCMRTRLNFWEANFG